MNNRMKQCIFHIGMPKTGTSSIQETLYSGLEDPSFRYIGLGRSNSGTALATLFSDQKTHFSHRTYGRSTRWVQDYRNQWLEYLDTVLTRTDAGVKLIFSAEYGWGMNRREFERVRNFMADRGYIVQIVAYIRPWKRWLESNFQQRIKMSLSSFQVSPASFAKIDYRARIQTLELVFGAGQVQVFKYDPDLFPEKCVVHHFCRQMGIHMDPVQIRRANDSLTLPALRLLYAYRRFGPGYGTGVRAVTENVWLIKRLHELRGSALHFHSSAVEPVIAPVLPQIPWLEERLGLPFTEDLSRYDDGPCIRTESDLFDFDKEALTWLAAATHSKPVRPASGEAAARAVAAQMHRLRRRISVGMRMRRLVRPITTRLRRLRG